jgi:protein-L-isoaspartate(D-aspartate) O-methyltransferase
MPDFDLSLDSSVAERRLMIETQIRKRGVSSPQVLGALLAVPRHEFIPVSLRRDAYADKPLAIGEGQTISQPYMVAAMTEALELTGSERVLEIGTGSGYQAAVLANLVRQVYTIEAIPQLAVLAARTLVHLGLDNVFVIAADGSLGLPAAAPFDAVLVTAGAPRAPLSLLEQLAPTGRLVIPVGPPRAQILQRWRRTANGFDYEDILPVAFVPLRGEQGWTEDQWQQAV